MQNEFYIAVYGTLKFGERNFDKLPKSEIEYIEDRLTDDACFQMYINPSTTTAGAMTPSVAFQEEGHHLWVQIFKVTQAGLNKMDEIEEEGVNYDRKPVTIEGYEHVEIYLKRDVSEGTIHSPHRIFNVQENSVSWSAHP